MSRIRVNPARVILIPFADKFFNLDMARKVTLNPIFFDTADEMTLNFKKEITTIVRQDGGKEVIEGPDPESGVYNATILERQDSRMLDLLTELQFPDALITVDGIKKKIEFFSSPGQLLSEWDKMVKAIIQPLGPNKQPLDATDGPWSTLPRCVIVPSKNRGFGVTPSKSPIQIISLGGEDEGTLALGQGDVDLSAPVDLSVGGTDKLLDITIDGVLKTINFGQGAATTGDQIVDAINEAFRTIVAIIDSDNFLTVSSIQPGGTVIVDDPAAGTSAYTAIYQSGGGAPDSQAGNQPFNVPVVIEGDETAA